MKFRLCRPCVPGFTSSRHVNCRLVLCDTHDTSILIVDTYVTIPVSPRLRHTAVYRSSTKYCETAQVSRVSTIPCSSYHLATSLQACDAETNNKVVENHNNILSSSLCTWPQFLLLTLCRLPNTETSKLLVSVFGNRHNVSKQAHTSCTVPHSTSTHYTMQYTIARHNVTGENRLRYM